MNKKEIDRVVKDLEFLNNELKKIEKDKNYKPQYPCNIDDIENEEDEDDWK